MLFSSGTLTDTVSREEGFNSHINPDRRIVVASWVTWEGL